MLVAVVEEVEMLREQAALAAVVGVALAADRVQVVLVHQTLEVAEAAVLIWALMAVVQAEVELLF